MKKTLALVLPAILLASAPAWANERYECVTEKKAVCSLDAGCETVASDTRFVIDITAQTYTRCDGKTCTGYTDFSVQPSGVYVIATRPGTMLKLLPPLGAQQLTDMGKTIGYTGPPERSTFVDVAMSGTAVYTSMGICRTVN